MMRLIKRLLRKSLNCLPSPHHPTLAYEGIHIRWRYGFIKGIIFKKYLLLRKFWNSSQVSIGKRFSLQGKIRIKGFGKVIIGDDVIIDGKTDIYTGNSSSEISIGHKCYLNGTRFGVQKKIVVEDECILSDSRIMDSDYHAIGKNRMSRKAKVLTSPVYIEKNVWIAGNTSILKGVRIGKDSVVAYGSIVTGNVEAGKVVGGYPAKVLRDI